jgi:hypothetical protein
MRPGLSGPGRAVRPEPGRPGSQACPMGRVSPKVVMQRRSGQASECSARSAYPLDGRRVPSPVVRTTEPTARRTGRSERPAIAKQAAGHPRKIGRETVDSASGPASPILTDYGRRAGSLGPGLTCESADALSGCPANDPSAGSQVIGTHRRCRPDLPVLWKRPGFTGPAASGCVPSLWYGEGLRFDSVTGLQVSEVFRTSSFEIK